MHRFEKTGRAIDVWACAMVIALTCVSAGAVTRSRNVYSNATGVCQAALPAYEGQIRKRPLAIQNEGTASAFVSCSFAGTSTGVGGLRSIQSLHLFADNNSAVSVSLTCTLVDSISGYTTAPTFITKTITLPANSKLVQLQWYAGLDNDGDNFIWTVNTSCNLPVGVGLTASYVEFAEDVGA